MVSKTNEQALEALIEKYLTATCLEELKADGKYISDGIDLIDSSNGYYIGSSNDFNPTFAIDEKRFWRFLELTQEKELVKVQRHSNWKRKILERYDRLVKKYGLLYLFRKGLDVEDANFTLLYQAPLASSGKSTRDKFESNQFSITRQIRYNLAKPREEIDMVVFINGLAIATIELKNPWTGQSARVQGIKQYKKDRDPKQPLLNFGRALVHFAVDTDEVYMATKLEGIKTFFLPFNKGNNNGKGNPINPNGHKSAYLWEDVLEKRSLINIIQHFVRFDGKAKDPLHKKLLFFPRYHQLDVVRKVLSHASNNGVGHTYLIQHSAGSGKSNSITWAAYQLIEAYPSKEGLQGSKGIDSPLFDTVIVVTDRRILDKQLRDNIKDFSEVKNIVAPAMSSKKLRESLEQGKKIVITTIQKFPHIIDEISDLSDRRFAVIIDEAHSSQSGSAASTMNQAMGEDEEENQDKILKAMKSRKMSKNASYFAFTATPKAATLERFGVADTEGKFKPFHLYSMKQAIEEGFILDVLANYTTYRSYYEISKSIEDNPLFDTKKAQKRLRNYVESDKSTIAVKSEIMIDHFITKVSSTKKLKGKAKAMVVSQSRASAIRYFLAIRKMLDEKGNPFKIIVAFSGKETVDGIEHSESSLNGFADKDTKDKFNTDEYRILVVANKYLTGFDQPKLCTMYVDKKLQGVMAVQALSRLNRSADHLAKRTEDVFVLDFFNQVDEIEKSFEPFYTSTSLSEATDVNVLHELKASLDDVGVYEQEEVEALVTMYFDNVDAEEFSPIIATAESRFLNELGLEDDEKIDFKIKAKQFMKIYGQMASIMPYEMLSWEKLFWFLKLLIPKLIIKTDDDKIIDDVLESIDLSTYGLERTKLNYSIGLDDAESEIDPQNPNPRGAHGIEEDKNPLDEIINSFNEKWFQGWDETPEKQRIRFININEKVQAHPDYKVKVADNKDTQNSDLALRKILDEVMSQHRRVELDFYKKYVKDEVFRSSLFNNQKSMLESKVQYYRV